MKRDYEQGVHTDITFFTGVEIEKTPAYGMKTLFVVGVHDPYVIWNWPETTTVSISILVLTKVLRPKESTMQKYGVLGKI